MTNALGERRAEMTHDELRERAERYRGGLLTEETREEAKQFGRELGEELRAYIDAKFKEMGEEIVKALTERKPAAGGESGG